MKFQILVDSSADMDISYLKDSNIGFGIVPLTIHAGSVEFVDDENIDTHQMLTTIHSTKEKSGTACPSPEAWLQHFSNAEFTFVVTMTSKLSGTFNSANVARDMAENKQNIYVFDTLATSGTLELVCDEIVRLIKLDKTFDEIISLVNDFIKTRNLFFLLHRFDNLVANGRMSRFAGFMAKTLVIKPICTASPVGTIDMVSKSIGSLNAYKKTVDLAYTRCTDFENRKCIITHCENEEDATKIKEMLQAKCNFKEIVVKPMRGLTSFYSLEKGLIICF